MGVEAIRKDVGEDKSKGYPINTKLNNNCAKLRIYWPIWDFLQATKNCSRLSEVVLRRLFFTFSWNESSQSDRVTLPLCELYTPRFSFHSLGIKFNGGYVTVVPRWDSCWDFRHLSPSKNSRIKLIQQSSPPFYALLYFARYPMILNQTALAAEESNWFCFPFAHLTPLLCIPVILHSNPNLHIASYIKQFLPLSLPETTPLEPVNSFRRLSTNPKTNKPQTLHTHTHTHAPTPGCPADLSIPLLKPQYISSPLSYPI